MLANIVLIIHLILALLLILLVLLQRSEGMVMNASDSSAFSRGRARRDPMTNATITVAALFFGTSLLLTVIANQRSRTTSIIDSVPGSTAPAAPAPATPEKAPEPAAPAGPAVPTTK